MQIGSRRNFFMGSLLLAAANTPYMLVDLINAVIQAEGGAAATQIIAGTARFFYIEGHPGIDGAGGNTNDVLLGEKISANAGNIVTNLRWGRVLSASGGTLTNSSTIDNVDWSNYAVQSAGVAQRVNVIISNG